MTSSTRYVLRSSHAGEFVRLFSGPLTWTPFPPLAANWGSATEAALAAISLGLEAHVTVEAV